jgi:hypothetical protein
LAFGGDARRTRKEDRVKKIIGLAMAGVLALVFSAACSIDAGVGGGDPGTCAEITCGDALMGGLAAGDNVLCTDSSDAAYQDLLDCACGNSSVAGACEAECSDNLCALGPESGDCGDCLNANCAPEHDTCANN